MRFLFLLFVIVPLIEIVLLINVGQMIGAWYCIGLVLLSAFIGVNMLRQQGLSTLMRARSRMDSGEIPAQEMMEGLILAVGGALLITPGFVTDVFGFSCLIPFIRRSLVKGLSKHFVTVAAGHSSATMGYGSESPHRPFENGHRNSGSRSGDVIDGEYHRDD